MNQRSSQTGAGKNQPQSYNIADARHRFSDLLARAEAGEKIIILRGNEPIARLTPLEPRPKRRPGRLRHLMSEADWQALIAAVEAPISEDEIAEMEGKPLFGETRSE